VGPRKTTRTVKAVAEAVGGSVKGDGSVELTGVANVGSAAVGHLVFVEEEKNLAGALDSRATAVMAAKFGRSARVTKPLIIVEQPRLAFARAAAMFSGGKRHKAGIHPAAVIHPGAKLSDGVRIEARVVVGEGADIGSGTRIGAGSVIGEHVRLGRDCEIYPNVTIYPGAKLGDRVIVHAGAVLGSDGFGYVRDSTNGRYEKFPQIGRLEIGDDVEIGANATVDRGALEVTRIARGTKIDNLVHIGHNCLIGEDVVIAAQTGISGSVVVENGVVIAGQVGIADHVRIEEGAILGAQCGVPTKKVIRGKGVVFWGTPARPIREYLKELAVLARLAKKKE
jgi:UDP-3-O-[3-hydroxymyristoyl] glucosamine N-acyltransferase